MRPPGGLISKLLSKAEAVEPEAVTAPAGAADDAAAKSDFDPWESMVSTPRTLRPCLPSAMTPL
eukprot:5662457-Lingulodinium_polyedra.AAC.1